MVILGLVGSAGAGKSTVGNFLSKEYGFRVDSFAAPLKDVVAAAFSLPRHLLEGDTDESRRWREARLEDWSVRLGKHVTPRILLQEVGTEVFRGYYKDIWVTSAMDRAKQYEDVVFTDVRFANEMEAIKQAGGYNILIHREGFTPHINSAHQSETEYLDCIDFIDFVVHNQEGGMDTSVLDYILEKCRLEKLNLTLVN